LVFVSFLVFFFVLIGIRVVLVLGVVVTLGFVTAVERKGKDCEEKKWVDESREAVGVEFEHISGESIVTSKRKRLCLIGKPLGL
jgi:hypothetical protein